MKDKDNDKRNKNKENSLDGYYGETEPDTVTVLLEDSEGIETLYELLSLITYEGNEYAVLFPQIAFESDELVILTVIRDAEGSIEGYRGIDDFDVLDAVFRQFCAESTDNR